MINSVRFYSILDNGGYAYECVYSEKQDLTLLAVDYLSYLVKSIGLDSALVTVMVEVKTNTRSRACCFGHFVVQGGMSYPTTPDFARVCREVQHSD